MQHQLNNEKKKKIDISCKKMLLILWIVQFRQLMLSLFKKTFLEFIMIGNE